ncbi:MAG: cadherin-like domain-containing protein, partial [Gemmataceae bacterium]|nr:cadherin-like domain-containing protein [Gemmataceae bacterium]
DARANDPPANGRPRPATAGGATAAPEAVRSIAYPDWANPNAPVATNNSYTVAEDKTVSFDPTADDTDADGHPVVLKEWPATTQYGVVRPDDGKLKYIPNPDFYGTDYFSYTVTDGEKTATADVTITVSPVNDPVQAYNDAFVFTRPTTQGTMTVGFDLVANDVDWDPQTVGAVPVEPFSLGAAGKASVGASGVGTWEIAPGFLGKTSFSYTATDKSGSTSTATVTLWAILQGTPGKPVTADPDVFPVGRKAIGGSVTPNDRVDGVTADGSNSVAVLVAAPTFGRLTAFGTDGVFAYTPHWSRTDFSFTYRLFRADGLGMTAVTAVQLPKVNLKAYHGAYPRGGNPVEVGVQNQNVTGAFTVANLNDSDPDGIQDNDDPDVPAVQPAGGEVDLIRLELLKPNDPRQNNPRKVRLEVTQRPEAVRLWKQPTKGVGQQIALDKTNGVEYGLGDFPANGILTVWAEIVAWSTAVGDVGFKMTYDGEADEAVATAIWTEGDSKWAGAGFYNTAATPWPAEANNPLKLTHQKTTGSTTLGPFDNKWVNEGKDKIANTADDEYRTGNSMLMRFTVFPGNLGQFAPAVVKLDIGRTMNLRELQADAKGNGAFTPDMKFPAWMEIVNDVNPRDNDTDLRYRDATGPHITAYLFSGDSPGSPGKLTKVTTADYFFRMPDGSVLPIRGGNLAQQFNAYEFVRVSIGAEFKNQNNIVEGSRSSVYYPWYSRIHIESVDPGGGNPWVWERGAEENNASGTGHQDFTF